MENLKNDCHVLLVIFPGQGHINPSLQFAIKLINLGVQVTLSTSLTAFSRIKNLPTIQGLNFAPFSDGYDGNFKGSFDEYHMLNSSIKNHGSEFISNLIKSKAKDGFPFTRIIYTVIMDWAGSVAKNNNVPSTLLWIQPATVFDIYYYRFTDYADFFKNCSQDEMLELPGLPPLSPLDFPSFVFVDVKSNNWAVESIVKHIELLNSEENPRILVNTFDDLEPDALRALKNVTMVGIGPLVAYDTSFGADMLQSSKNYMDWLDARPNESVIYIAFGSYTEISSQLVEELGQGLLKCGRPFLWVIREGENGKKLEEILSCKDELEKHGKLVPWCSQVEVLKHPSLGCFLTHCGWNSTMESLVFGVPVVACPIWNDQVCNAKLVQDAWKTGVKVNANVEGNIERDEFKRCIEIAMGSGDEGEELRKNAKKWRDLAKDAMKENGSSNVNLKAYVKETLLGHC